MRQDVKNNKNVNITRYFFRGAKQGPKAHGQCLKDPANPRDDKGNLVWVNANSNAEKLLGSHQKHADWTGSAGERNALHYCKQILDKDGRVESFAINPNISPPSDDDIDDLLPDRGISLSADEREKFRAAHNDRTSKPFKPPEINPLFAYPFIVKANKPDFDHPEVR